MCVAVGAARYWSAEDLVAFDGVSGKAPCGGGYVLYTDLEHVPCFSKGGLLVLWGFTAARVAASLVKNPTTVTGQMSL